MKFFILSAVLLIVSCGRTEVAVPSQVNGTRSTDPLVVDSAVVTQICQALTQKSPNAHVNTQVNFTIARKGCDDAEIRPPVDIITTIQNSLNGYRFVQTNGMIPYFGDIETLDRGTMSPICAQLITGTLTSPIANGNEFTYFRTASIAAADCAPRANEVCIEVTKASGSGDNTATEHTKEWIRFNLSTAQGKVGFWTLKKQETSASCIAGKTLINTAILR